MRHKDRKSLLGGILLGVLALCLLLVEPALATNRYILAGSSGTQAATGCSDWTTTNACPDLPSSLNRGDLYYVAGGTYGQHVFSDADSGTTIIEIRAATITDHGTSTGWLNTLQGAANFVASGSGTPNNAIFEFRKDYYLINGNGVRNADWQGGYLIHVNDNNHLAPEASVMIGLSPGGSVGAGTFVHDIVLDYVELEGTHQATDTTPINCCSNVLESLCVGMLRHSLVHDGGNTLMFIKGKHDSLLNNGTGLCNASSTGAQWIIEYSYFFRNYSSSAKHGEGAECDEGQYCTFRYNWFRDITGTAYIATPSGCGRTTCNIDNQWDIYGNILQEKNSFSDNGVPCGVGGAFQVFDVVFNGPVKFYNNTMVNINSSICPNNSVAGGIFVQQTSPTADLKGGLIVQNNLWYNNDSFTAVNSCSTCSSLVWDHNAYFAQPITDTDPNAQIVAATNPFVSSGTDNFRLAAATLGGVTLASPFNTDMDGTTRGVDGVWDRGAFEFDSGKRPPLPPPKVSLVIH